MRDLIQKIDSILKESVEHDSKTFQIGDEFGISFSEDLEIATTIVGFAEDGIVVELDDTAIDIMESNGARFVDGYLEESLKDPKKNPCWKGYKPVGTKKKGGKTVPNCVPKEGVEETQDPNLAKAYRIGNAAYKTGNKDSIKTIPQQYKAMWVKGWEDGERFAKEGIDEAEYQGRDVTLNKPMSNPDSGSKSKVYVKDPKTGNVKKVTFGDPNMRIKKSNPERRKSFRARHNCDNPGPKTKARYWSCKAW